jgi:hypothetical protein
MPSLRDYAAGGFMLEGMLRELPQMQSGGMAARKFYRRRASQPRKGEGKSEGKLVAELHDV